MSEIQMAERRSLYNIFQGTDSFFYPMIELCKSDK